MIYISNMNKQIPLLVGIVALVLIAWLIFCGSSTDSSSEDFPIPSTLEAPTVPKVSSGK